jgi:RNA polymerase sigma-70 factor (ECF subfamily)
MTGLGPVPTAATTTPERADWVSTLSLPGPERDLALSDLHGLLVHAARSQVYRMGWATRGEADVDELANQAADDALVALLGKLHTFEGRSRFTTWAYKFAVLHAANAVRAAAWRGREIQLDGLELLPDTAPHPGHYAEARDLVEVVRRLLDTVLTPHQRRIVVALVVNEVPIDVLAERLGTNRNALYKTLHDARVRIRAALVAEGFLEVPRGGAR